MPFRFWRRSRDATWFAQVLPWAVGLLPSPALAHRVVHAQPSTRIRTAHALPTSDTFMSNTPGARSRPTVAIVLLLAAGTACGQSAAPAAITPAWPWHADGLVRTGRMEGRFRKVAVDFDDGALVCASPGGRVAQEIGRAHV